MATIETAPAYCVSSNLVKRVVCRAEIQVAKDINAYWLPGDSPVILLWPLLGSIVIPVHHPKVYSNVCIRRTYVLTCSLCHSLSP